MMNWDDVKSGFKGLTLGLANRKIGMVATTIIIVMMLTGAVAPHIATGADEALSMEDPITEQSSEGTSSQDMNYLTNTDSHASEVEQGFEIERSQGELDLTFTKNIHSDLQPQDLFLRLNGDAESIEKVKMKIDRPDVEIESFLPLDTTLYREDYEFEDGTLIDENGQNKDLVRAINQNSSITLSRYSTISESDVDEWKIKSYTSDEVYVLVDQDGELKISQLGYGLDKWEWELDLSHRLEMNEGKFELIRSLRRSSIFRGLAREKAGIDYLVAYHDDIDEEDVPKKGDVTNPAKVLLGIPNRNILEEPDLLEGEYEVSVTIHGENIDVSEKETNLKILGEPASPPRNLEGEYKDDEVRLEWDEPEEKGGSDIMQYDIYRATSLYNYEYIGNVTADQTEYVDELEGDSNQQDPREGDILYYRVVAINVDDYYYLTNEQKRNFHHRLEYMSEEEIVHLSHEETEKSDTSYKWMMDYSNLSENYFEDRVNMDSVSINKMEGGEVFFYDVTKTGEENGEIVYEYEGGFVSQGEVDMDLEDGEDLTSELQIDVNEIWCDFSGKIWAEEFSSSGYEGLKITKQTIQSEGHVGANVDNSYDFNLNENQTHWESSKELDIEWTIDLSLDYKENNSWIMKERIASFAPFYGKIDYSGSIEAEAELRKESNQLDDEKKKEDNISKDISGDTFIHHHIYGGGDRITFSPIVGACNIGYYSALNHTTLITYQEILPRGDSFTLGFTTECQKDGFSTENLYKNQYMDPMALPGLGSVLGIELKKPSLFDSDSLESWIQERIRRMKQEMEEEPEEGWAKWTEQRRAELKERLLNDISLESPWRMHQTHEIYRWQRYNSTAVVEPLGYFASEPLSEDEIESYNEDRDQFFEDQMAGEDSTEEEDNGGGLLPGYTSAVLLVSILLSVVIYSQKRNKKQT